MTARFYWRRAHPVRIPDKVNTPPHVEMFEAYQRDQINREVAEMLTWELDREFRQEAR